VINSDYIFLEEVILLSIKLIQLANEFQHVILTYENIAK